MGTLRNPVSQWTSVAVVALSAISALADDDPIQFNRDVRPILADNCFQCHGPDSTAREADLRLDTRDGLFAREGDETIVAPGDPAASELYRRVSSDDADERMPPADSGKSLSADEIGILRRWIAEGADWQRHWAFEPVRRPEPPDVANQAWVRNGIDDFILAELERQELVASPEASPETLLRRVTLDLTGLPPTTAETDAYLNDTSPDRYERLVDRLLESPRYGEHMAVTWLDAARYADTSGYQNDGPRSMWRWRDWVIDAYNAGMPFDRFTIEQLAGDLLPDATLEQRIATGFNRNHRGNSEGGIIPEEYAVEYVVDRVDTTGAVWLGLTIGCARCHEHKFDPISHDEYYRLFAYFNNIPENGRSIKEGNSPPYIQAPTDDQREKLALLDRQLETARADWNAWEQDANDAQQTWEPSLASADGESDWTVTDGLIARFPLNGDCNDIMASERVATSTGGELEFVGGVSGEAAALNGETFLDAGDVAKFGYFDAFSAGAWIKPEGDLSGGIVTRMSDDVYHDGWALHLEHGHVQVNLSKRWLDDSLRVETETEIRPDRWQHVMMTYDGSRKANGVAVYINGERQPLRVIYDFLNQTITNEEPLRIGATGTQQRLTGAIADVRVYGRALSGGEAAIVATPESPQQIAGIPVAQRTPAQAHKLREYFLAAAAPDEIANAYRRLQDLEASRKQFVASLPTTMVMYELDTPRDTFVLERGEYNRPGERVSSGVPEVLGAGDATSGGNRLDLARWIASPDNPLTARVAVNRYWQRIFGTGLVKTSEDFGSQGERPSHPELLDWLADEFVRTGWDVKRMQRLIVTSATYRQSSDVTPELFARDPENRLLARGPRFRLPAEQVRDEALAVSGLLTERIGGPSVRPYQPAGLWAEIATDTVYEQSTGADLYRRTLYTYWKRTVTNPTLTAFDAGTREACTMRRGRTNTPLQALTLLNDVTFVEAARALAQRTLEEAPQTDADRVAWMFHRATGRKAEQREQDLFQRSVSAYRDHFRANPDAAGELLAIGESAIDPEVAPAELATYTAVASVILNLDEVVTKE